MGSVVLFLLVVGVGGSAASAGGSVAAAGGGGLITAFRASNYKVHVQSYMGEGYGCSKFHFT